MQEIYYGKFEKIHPPTYDQEAKVYPSLPSETKVDPPFPSNQFAIEGFSFSFGLDRNSSAGGVMLFVRDEILSKHLKPYFNPSKQSYSKGLD